MGFPRAAARRRRSVAGALTSDKDEDRIGTFTHDLSGGLQRLREPTVGLKVARDKSHDGRIVGLQHATIRKPDRSRRVGTKQRRIDTLVADGNALTRIGGIEAPLPFSRADAAIHGFQ
ncbi:hypothetical protein D3C72_2237580 [compost metagenome]